MHDRLVTVKCPRVVSPSEAGLKRLGFHLRIAAATVGFVAASLCAVAWALLRRDTSRVAHDYGRLIARWMRPALGIRVVERNADGMLARRPCVYVSNHQSMYDVVVLASLYPPDTVIIAKQELRSTPFFGWIFEKTGNIYIDRARREQAVGRLQEAERAILERNRSVWIFPEGTRGTTSGELLPFKKGAFHIALATGVPLVPVVIAPYGYCADPQRRHVQRETVEVRVLEPIEPAEFAAGGVEGLREETRSRMQAALREMEA